MLHSDVFSAMSAKLSNQGHTMVNPSACLSKYFTCSSVIRSAEEFNWTCCNVAGGADMEAASIAPDEDNGVPAGSTSIEQSRLCSVRESCVRPCAPVASQMLNDTHNAIDMFLRTSFGCNRCTSIWNPDQPAHLWISLPSRQKPFSRELLGDQSWEANPSLG